MHPVVLYTGIFIVLGGVGMAISNRKVTPIIRKQRWLKFFTYIFITGTVLAAILYNLFSWLAWGIAIIGMAELVRINFFGSRQQLIRTIFGLSIYILVATGFILFAETFRNSFLLFIYFQVLIFDGFCQITGQLFGKHPLVPSISPTKTWEGLIGGWLFCILASCIAANWVPMVMVAAPVFGLLTGLCCFYGDLLASYYKRKLKIKDYSNWLPGQGGFLDRFDSFLFTGAIYYLIYIIIFRDGFEEFIKM